MKTEKFNAILENYINGNRGDARNQFEKLSRNEKSYDFRAWVNSEHAEGNPHIFEFVLFLLCA